MLQRYGVFLIVFSLLIGFFLLWEYRHEVAPAVESGMSTVKNLPEDK